MATDVPPRRERRFDDAAWRAALAERLAALRTRARLSQPQVSRALAMPRSWIGKLETGRRALLLGEAIALAQLYRVPLSALDPDQPMPDEGPTET